ncbi:MAG: PHP domain-containing protein [Acetatifactor sp.]|nr:PHP domain-containing protein [Acetatifactor sp.]
MRAVDLHVHTTFSDGTLTPSEIVDLAMSKGLAAVAITDHDSVAGIDEALARRDFLVKADIDSNVNLGKGTEEDNFGVFSCGSGSGAIPEIVPGIELSTEYEGKDVHIVGLFIDHRSKEFNEYLTEFVESRINRNKKICSLLTKAGYPFSYEELMERFSGSSPAGKDIVVTRAHYARLLMEKGYVKSIPEAFDRFIGDHAPFFVPREKITPEKAISLILSAGGIPILAHPVLYHMSKDRLNTLVSCLKEAGLLGIEALYSTYNRGDERNIFALAKKYDLFISGGSDFHGANKANIDLGTGMGRLFVPSEYYERMKEYHSAQV